MALNPMGKARKVDAPYLIIDGGGGWEYRVLKANTTNPGKPGGSWYCAVKSPHTFGGFDMGDTYITDIRGEVTFRDPVVTDDLLPRHLGGKVAAAKNPMDAFGW
jgi:hypothetical protein